WLVANEAGRDAGRDEDGRDADAEPVKGKRWAGGSGHTGKAGIGRRAGDVRRRNMVLDATVFVVGDEQEGIVPVRAGVERSVDLSDEGFAGIDGEVRMLAVGIGADGYIVIIGRLNKDVLGQVALGGVVNKLGEKVGEV